jgi:hypothetical protein
LAADGLTAIAISAGVGKSVLAVRRWRRRYMAKGVHGLLKDATRPSRVKPLTPEKIRQVVHKTHQQVPACRCHLGEAVGAAVAAGGALVGDERAAERGDNLGAIIAALLRLLERYGASTCAASSIWAPLS